MTPKLNDITTSQRYKILEIMGEKGEMAAQEISEFTGFPMSSVRRILSELDAVGKITKRNKCMIYKIREE